MEDAVTILETKLAGLDKRGFCPGVCPRCQCFRICKAVSNEIFKRDGVSGQYKAHKKKTLNTLIRRIKVLRAWKTL